MPNWCKNQWHLAHPDPEVLQRAVDALTSAEGQVTFNKLLPTPADVADEDDWCDRAWGTKWDAGDGDIAIHGGSAVLTFETAWCAPEGVYRALRARHPAVSVEALWSADDGEIGTLTDDTPAAAGGLQVPVYAIVAPDGDCLDVFTSESAAADEVIGAANWTRWKPEQLRVVPLVAVPDVAIANLQTVDEPGDDSQ